MTSRSTRLVVVLLAAIAPALACAEALPLESRPCPCSAGWTCCAADNVCIPAGAVCEGRCTCANDPARDPQACRGGACVPVYSPDCRVLRGARWWSRDEPDLEELKRESAVVIGVLVPQTGPRAEEGRDLEHAVDVVLSDLVYRQRTGRHAFAVVCDDQVDPVRAVRHLVNDLDARLVIGPSDVAAATRIAPELMDRGVVTIVPTVRDVSLIPPPGRRGTIWQLANGRPARDVGEEVRASLLDGHRSRFRDYGEWRLTEDVLGYYDAAYLAFYGLYGAGALDRASTAALSPSSFGAQMAKLVGGGPTFRVGPFEFETVLARMNGGEKSNLEGLSATLDWGAEDLP